MGTYSNSGTGKTGKMPLFGSCKKEEGVGKGCLRGILLIVVGNVYGKVLKERIMKVTEKSIGNEQEDQEQIGMRESDPCTVTSLIKNGCCGYIIQPEH